MHIKTAGICRGSEKVFALCGIPRVAEGVTVRASAKESGRGVAVPCALHPYESDDEGLSWFVCCLPVISGPGYVISLETSDGARGELSLSSKQATWESRLNYRLHPELCRSLRDYDYRAAEQTARIEFTDCIAGGERNVLRGTVLLPLREDNAPRISCLTQGLEPVDLSLTIMGTSVEGADTYEPTLAVQFSARIPAALGNYIFVFGDENHPELDGFEVLFAGWYGELLARTGEVMRSAQVDPGYPGWFEAHRASARELAGQAAAELERRPSFSVIVPLFRTPADFFEDMVESVRSQSYAPWELVLVNASPESAELAGLVERACASDARIRAVTLEDNLGISENTNAGIALATGDYVCFFDHDDVLEPDLLFEYALALNEDPKIDLLYCDEDKLLPDGTFAQPYFKPDFNLDLLRNNNYVCHMLTVRRSLLAQIEPNTRDYDGAQDHNLTLRVAERTSHIHHVPKVLYHWRMSPSSTAGDAGSKSYASEAGIRAVSEHLKRCGIAAKVTLADRPFTYRVIYDVPEERPLVSIIIPTKDHVDLLSRCVDSILEKSTYKNYEIVLVENNSVEPETFAYYKELEAAHPGVVRVARWDAEFNFSKLMNFGRRNARGDYLLLLNNDTEVITPSWIETMLGLAAREDVGAVGVRLFYPDDTIQHAGTVIAGGVATHVHKNLPRGVRGYFALDDAQMDLSAVTAACVMTSCRAFDAVGGFTEELQVAFNDIDFCLKLRERSLLVVYTPEVELYHYESISRGTEDNDEKRIRFHREIAYMNYHWAPYYVKGDPYSNPNVTRVDPRNAYYHL